MPYLIRPLTKEDIDQVNAIDREAFPTQWPPPNYRQELNNRIAHYITVTDDTRVLDPPLPKKPGGLRKILSRLLPALNHEHNNPDPPPQPFIAGFSGIWMMADEAHITNIAVRRAYRGKGLGGLLLIATYDMARELKASFLTLEVRASNTVAQCLYTRYGFKQTGVRRGYYLDNKEDAIIMSTDGLTSPALQEQIQQLRESLSRKVPPPTGWKRA